MFKTGVPAAHSTIFELPYMHVVHTHITQGENHLNAWLGLIKWVISRELGTAGSYSFRDGNGFMATQQQD